MIIKLITIIILIFLIFHYKIFNKKNNKIEVYQLNEFDKQSYEKSINSKQPIILYNFLNELISFNKLSFDSLKDMDNMKIIVNNKEIDLVEFINNVENNIVNDIDYVYYENNNILDYIDLPLNNELKLLTSPISVYKSKNLTIAPIDYMSPLLYTNFERNVFMIYEGSIELYIYKPLDIKNLYFNKKYNIYYI